jgi:hypothetical protein
VLFRAPAARGLPPESKAFSERPAFCACIRQTTGGADRAALKLAANTKN